MVEPLVLYFFTIRNRVINVNIAFFVYTITSLQRVRDDHRKFAITVKGIIALYLHQYYYISINIVYIYTYYLLFIYCQYVI